MNPKEEAQSRRFAMVFGPLAGVGIYFMVKYAMIGDHQPAWGLFLGRRQHFPWFTHPFAPLDIIATSFWFWLLMHLLLVKVAGKGKDGPVSLSYALKTVAAVAVGYAAAGGVFGSAMYGSYWGIEFALMLGVAGAALAVALWLGLAFVFGLAAVGVKASDPVVHRMANWRIVRYFNADDVDATS